MPLLLLFENATVFFSFLAMLGRKPLCFRFSTCLKPPEDPEGTAWQAAKGLGFSGRNLGRKRWSMMKHQPSTENI